MSDKTYKSIPGEPGYYVMPKSGIIYFIKSIDAKTIKFSCRTDNILKAKRYANTKLKEKLGIKKANVTPLLGELMLKYLKEREHDEITASTYRVVSNSINDLIPFFEKYRTEDISKDLWIKCFYWYKEKYEGKQVENALKYFKNFCFWLKEQNHMGRPLLFNVPRFPNPEAKKVRQKRQNKKSRILTKPEIKSILSVCSDDEKLIVLLLYTMGFRISEACGLKWSSLDLAEDEPIYRFSEGDNKAGHIGTQGIHSAVLELLIQKEMTSPFVFPQRSTAEKHIAPQQINWKRIKKESGVTWSWSPHTFRHTCLTELFSNPENAQAIIMKCFRISYRVALDTYIHVTAESRAKLKDAIEI